MSLTDLNHQLYADRPRLGYRELQLVLQPDRKRSHYASLNTKDGRCFGRLRVKDYPYGTMHHAGVLCAAFRVPWRSHLLTVRPRGDCLYPC